MGGIMKRIWPWAASFAFFLVAGAHAADSARGPNVDRNKRASSPLTEAVAQAALGDQVARHADRNKDVLAMLAAIRLLGQVGSRPAKVELRTEGGQSAATDAKAGGASPRDTTLQALLARAKQYAGGRNDLNGLVDELARAASRPRQDGPSRHAQRVAAGATDVYTFQFRANEPVMVALTGEGTTDLDLTVEDDAGHRICSSDGAGDDEICRWTPVRNGAFRIKVRNVGKTTNEYRLWSN
jgi:hypothetical protein